MDSKSYFSREELENLIAGKSSSLDIFKIFGAYDMAESAYQNKYRMSGTPHFYHISRICKIVVEELKILESDIVIASMLQDILIVSDDVDLQVIEFNFGKYAAFLIESLTFENKRQKQREFRITDIKELGSPDGLLLRLAKSLDNLRYLDFELLENPISYLNSVINRYFYIAEKSEEKFIHYLLNEIKKESNKLIG